MDHLWFGVWHWIVRTWDSTPNWLGPALGAIAIATFSAFGGYAARRREDIRSRRAAMLTTGLSELRDHLDSHEAENQQWNRITTRLADELTFEATACSPTDRRKVGTIVEAAWATVDALAALQDQGDADRSVIQQLDHANLTLSQPARREAREAEAARLGQEREPLVSALKSQHEVMLQAVLDYEEFLSRKLNSWL